MVERDPAGAPVERHVVAEERTPEPVYEAPPVQRDVVRERVVEQPVYAAPVCPYGYYATYPYSCAPYGYYGPDLFSGGIFIGAGPWYHGRDRFWGHVDNRFDRNDGYRGQYPQRGEHFTQDRRPGRVENFRGNEARDAHGHSNLGAAHEHGGGGHPR